MQRVGFEYSAYFGDFNILLAAPLEAFVHA